MVESVNSVSDNSKFAVSLVTPWIKGSMNVDDNFMKIDMPNTVFFGLIPAGKSKDTSPLSGVTNVYTSNSYKIGAIALGVLFALAGLSMFGTSFFGGLIVVLIGVGIAGSGIKTRFSYERAGIEKSIDVPFFEADHVRKFEQDVLKKLQGYQDDRNVRMQTQKTIVQSKKNTEAIVNAVKGDDAEAPSTEAAFCSNCGEQVSAGAKFCNHCGNKLN